MTRSWRNQIADEVRATSMMKPKGGVIDDIAFRAKNGKVIPFKLTPRRKEILWHIAYDFEVYVKLRPNFAMGFIRDRVPVFHLGHTNVHQIVILLRRTRLVEWEWSAPAERLRITPLGMQVLLESVS